MEPSVASVACNSSPSARRHTPLVEQDRPWGPATDALVTIRSTAPLDRCSAGSQAGQEQERDIGGADVNSALTSTAAPLATAADASPVAVKAVAAAPAVTMAPDSPLMASPAPAQAPSASKSRLNLFSNHLYIALEQDGCADASADDQDDRDQGRETQLQGRQSNGGTASALSSLLTSSASFGGAAAATPAALQPPASALLHSVCSVSSSVMPHLGLDLFRGDSNPLSGMGGDTGRDSSEEEGEAEPLRMPMRSFLDAIASCTTPLQPTSSAGSGSAAAADRPAGYPMASITSFVGAASGVSQPAIRCYGADATGSQATMGPSGTSNLGVFEQDMPCSPVVPLKTESEAARVLTASALKRAFSTPAQQQQGQRLGQQGQRQGPERCSLLPQLSESALSAAASGEAGRSCLAPSSGIPTLLIAHSPSCSVPHTPSALAAATSTPKSGSRRGGEAVVTPVGYAGSSCQEGAALGDRKENMGGGSHQHAAAGGGSAQGKRSATKVVTPLGPSSNHNTPGSGTKSGLSVDKLEKVTGGRGGQSAERAALSGGARGGTAKGREAVAGKAGGGGAGGQKAAVPRRQQLYGWMVS